MMDQGNQKDRDPEHSYIESLTDLDRQPKLKSKQVQNDLDPLRKCYGPSTLLERQEKQRSHLYLYGTV